MSGYGKKQTKAKIDIGINNIITFKVMPMNNVR